MKWRAGILGLLTVSLAGCADLDSDAVSQLDSIPDLAFFGVDGDPMLGNPDAPVQVVAFEAPGCGNCKHYHANAYQDVFTDFIATGQIGYHFLQWTVGYSYDIEAGVALECAHREGGTDAYLALLGPVFDEQHQLDLPQALDDLAAARGLDAAILATCFEEQETLQDVQQDIERGRASRAGFNPGFAVRGPDGVHTERGKQGPYALIEQALADI